MGYLTFKTEAEAELAQSLISKELGLPKYGEKLDGSLNTRVIIDKYAIPHIQEDGSWVIPDTKARWERPKDWDNLVLDLNNGII